MFCKIFRIVFGRKSVHNILSSNETVIQSFFKRSLGFEFNGKFCENELKFCKKTNSEVTKT